MRICYVYVLYICICVHVLYICMSLVCFYVCNEEEERWRGEGEMSVKER